MSKTKIEWTDDSWNPIRARNIKTGKVGWHCEHATTGCEHCYAEGINKRLGTGLPFKPGHRADVEIFVDEKMLLAPLKWKRPRKIFVGSMTDLFASFVTDEMIDQILEIMALCPQHTFQVLTKRAERMRNYLIEWAAEFSLENVWLGVSCEHQEEADERIPFLLQTPAAVRFISAEPLLSALNLDHYLRAGSHRYVGSMMRGALQWVIVGGESGQRARPMHPQWARDLRDQCHAAGVAFFFKQWGEWAPGENASKPQTRTERVAEWFNGDWNFGTLTPKISLETHADDSPDVWRLGKQAAGSMLDGREHKDFPAPAA